jgi:phospholipid transport system substrate-binding protein
MQRRPSLRFWGTHTIFGDRLAFYKFPLRILGTATTDIAGGGGDSFGGNMTTLWSRRLDRRKIVTGLIGSAVGGLVSYPAAARAAADPAEVYVSNIADQVMALANSGDTGKSLRNKFAVLLGRYINLRNIANYSLGTYRSKMPASAKDEFYQLVNNYSAALFVYYVKDFRGSKLDITSNAQQGKFITIQSAIKQKGGGREQVRWRLLADGDNYRVSDVNIKGVWLTIAMKDRFTKVLNNSHGDFDALFESLREAETW